MSYILRGLLYESTHSGIIYYFLIISISFISKANKGEPTGKQFAAPSIEIDRQITTAQVSRVRFDDKRMKRSYLETVNSRWSYDNGPKRMAFQSSGIFLKPDNKAKQVDNKINPADIKSNLNQANGAFEQMKKSFLKTSNSNQLNSTVASVQTSASSPTKREPILSPNHQAISKKAAQLFTNVAGTTPQTTMFTNFLTPAAKSPARNSQSASTATPASNSKTSTPPVQFKNPQQQNMPNPNPFVNACRFQASYNGGGTMPIIGASVPRQENSVVLVAKSGPDLTTQAVSNDSLNNSFIGSLNRNMQLTVGNNAQINGFTGQTSSHQPFQNPQQNIFCKQNTSQKIIQNHNNNPNSSNQAPINNQSHNIFQPSPQHQHSPQPNLKSNKPTNSSQKQAPKYTKIPTLAGTNNNSNHISLDGYFPRSCAQAPTPPQNINQTINSSLNINYGPKTNLPSPTARTAPSLFDPNYHFQYVSDPIFQQQMEIQMDELTVEEFIAKSTAQMTQICEQLQQMCNKCLGRLKERSQVGQINNIFDQLDRYTLKDSLVSRQLDLLEVQQYEMEKSLTALQKMFPGNCMHSLSHELQDYHELEDLVKRLEEQEEGSPQFQSVLLLYQSLHAIEERVKDMDGKLDLLSGLQQQ